MKRADRRAWAHHASRMVTRDQAPGVQLELAGHPKWTAHHRRTSTIQTVMALGYCEGRHQNSVKSPILNESSRCEERLEDLSRALRNLNAEAGESVSCGFA